MKKKKEPPVAKNSPQQALLDKAEQYIKKIEYALAEKLASEVLALSGGKATLPKEEEARAFCILGDCSLFTARYDEAFGRFKNALVAAKSSANLGLQSRAFHGIANVQCSQSDFKSAIDTAERGLPLAEKIGDDRQQAQLHNVAGSALNSLGEYLLAKDRFSRSFAIAEKLGNKSLIATSLGNIGTVHIYLAEYPSAMDCFTQVHAIGEAIGNKYLIANALANMGYIHWTIADYSRALEYFNRAHDVAEEIGDKHIVASMLGNIGNIHDELSDKERALDYTLRAITLAEEIGAKHTVAVNLGNLGMIFTESGDYTQGLKSLQRALEISKQIGDQTTVGFSIVGIAYTEKKRGNLDAAYQGFLDALHHRREILKSENGVAETLLDIGRILIAKGNMSEGLTQLEEALQLAEKLGEKKSIPHMYAEISEAYAKMGDMAKAYAFITKYNAIEKEILSEELKKKVGAYNMRTAIAEQEKETEVQKLKAQHLEIEMKTKQEELSNKALLLVQQTDMLQSLRHDLDGIVRHADTAEKAVRSIRVKLKEIPEHLLNWEKFSEDFRNVHPDFEKNIKKKYPSLSKAEVKVSCLLRIGMSTREISTLLFLNERTVESHRLSIRKKLMLEKKTDLHEILSRL